MHFLVHLFVIVFAQVEDTRLSSWALQIIPPQEWWVPELREGFDMRRNSLVWFQVVAYSDRIVSKTFNEGEGDWSIAQPKSLNPPRVFRRPASFDSGY
jgi:hypothetical protein